MNNRGQFDLDGMGLSILFALIGGVVAYFTANGGFIGWEEGTSPPFIMKAFAGVLGAVAGWVWGYYQSQ
jgi:hypothetical protein